MRGLKLVRARLHMVGAAVALSRVRGLKRRVKNVDNWENSRTLTSAWIETIDTDNAFERRYVALSRVRGLKLAK